MRQPRIKLKIVHIIIHLRLNQPHNHPCLPPDKSIETAPPRPNINQFIINKIKPMSRYQYTNNSTPTPNNPPTTTNTKITRTNPYNQQSSRLNTNSKNNAESSIIELLPNKVSALDSNVLFQDLDRIKEKNVKSTNSNSLNQSAISSVKAEDTLGLVTNVFLGATNKFVKGSNMPSTPKKPILPTEEEQQDLPVNLPVSKVISRNRQQKSTVERVEGQSTERSQAQSGRKLERKRQLKFIQKKEESRQKASQIKVEYSNKKQDPPQEQKVEKVQEDYPKLYQQPVQKPTPYSRSRLITQPIPKQQEPQPPKIEETKKQEVIPKPQVKPVVNRLVKSRLQSNFSQSKSQIQQIPSQNDFSKVEIRQNTIIITQQAQIPPKQEIKPKPYSRSFITKKVQPQPNKMNASTINPISTSIIKSQQNEANKKQQVAIQLKKSYCAGFIIKRLIQNRFLDAFSTLKTNKQALRIKFNTEGLLLSYATIKITKHKEINLLRMGMQNIKKKFTTPYIASLKGYTDLPTSYKNTPILLIDRLYSAKIRSAFNILKQSLQTLNNKVKCLATLQTLTKKKVNYYIKIGVESIKLKNQTQLNKLHQFASIYSQVSKNKVANAFIKLTAVKPINSQAQTPSKIQQKPTKALPVKIQQSSPINTTNQTLIDKLQKLKKVSLTVNEQITTIKSSLQQKKSSIEQEKGGFSQKITLLKHQNGQASNEIEIKKHRNDQIQKQMQNMSTSNKQASLEELPQQRSDKFELITNIYISNFKNQQETISTQQIINTYQLHPQDSALLFRQWESILHNVELKRLIAAYEGVQGRQNKGRSNLLGEQTLVSKLIRSYVKEQYFWNWIHVSAQNI